MYIYIYLIFSFPPTLINNQQLMPKTCAWMCHRNSSSSSRGVIKNSIKIIFVYQHHIAGGNSINHLYFTDYVLYMYSHQTIMLRYNILITAKRKADSNDFKKAEQVSAQAIRYIYP